MCFVLQQAGNVESGVSPIGDYGSDMGYAGGPFETSLVVEIDTWEGFAQFDPAADHIGIGRDGSVTHNVSPPVQADPQSTNIETGLDYAFRITWGIHSCRCLRCISMIQCDTQSQLICWETCLWVTHWCTGVGQARLGVTQQSVVLSCRSDVFLRGNMRVPRRCQHEWRL